METIRMIVPVECVFPSIVEVELNGLVSDTFKKLWHQMEFDQISFDNEERMQIIHCLKKQVWWSVRDTAQAFLDSYSESDEEALEAA